MQGKQQTPEKEQEQNTRQEQNTPQKQNTRQDGQPAGKDILSILFPSIAVYLRGSMSNVYLCARRLATAPERRRSADTDATASMLDQNYYRAIRMLNNLSLCSYFNDPAPLPMRSGDIVKPVREICAKAEYLLNARDVSVSFSCVRERYACMFSRFALEEILYQLLSNAAKFTPSGGKIHVELRPENGQILLSETDSGPGVPPEQVPILFERYRHPERMDPPPHAFGLGLSICRVLAEKHGGAMRAEFPSGGGSRFTLAVPDVRPENPAVLVSESKTDRMGGFDPMLAALSESLPPEAFSTRKKK